MPDKTQETLSLFDEMLPTPQPPPAAERTPAAPATASEPAPRDDDTARALLERPAEAQTPEHTAALPDDARRALVTLLRQGVLLGSRKKAHFSALQRHESAIRAQLDNLFLDLLIDEKSGIALIQQRDAEQDDVGDMATLIARRPLTLYDSLLLIVLRRHYQQREAEGENRILIDAEQIEAQLRPFLPLSNSASSATRKLSGALDKLEKHKLLNKIRGEDDRYEITPIIRYVVNADLLQALLSEYTELAAKVGADLSTEDTAPDTQGTSHD